MLRLRTTTALSMLGLLIGIAGTGWLSSLTDQWQQPSARMAMVGRTHDGSRTPSKIRRSHAPVRVVLQPRRVRHHDIPGERTGQAAVSSRPITLQPLATPDDHSQSWARLRGHLDGRVIVWLRIDGLGQVVSASVATTSGDPILDQHALRNVRGWRFAVPPGHPDGISGELPMLFSSQARGLGML